MRRFPAIAVLVLAALAALPQGALAQDSEDDGEGLVPVDPFRPRRTPGADHNPIHVREARHLQIRCREAEEAEAKADFARASRGYLDVLREERSPEDGVSGNRKSGERRWTSYARYARERLLAFPEAGRAAFRALADQEARAQLEQALKDGDLRALESVWRTYPLASCADEALERLGDAAYEAGDAAVALDRYTLAATIAGADLDPKRIGAKVAAARALLEALRAAPAPAVVLRSPVTGGDGAHAAPLPALLAVEPKERYFAPLPPSNAGRNWGLKTRSAAPRFDGSPLGRDEVTFPETVAAIDRGRIVLANGNAASCYDLATGERRWYQGVWPDPDPGRNVFYGATIANGRVFAPFTKRCSRAEFFRGIPICESIPYRRLVAFSLETGKRLWDHAESQNEFLRDAFCSVALPPVVRDGVLYATAWVFSGQFKVYVIAVDAASGRLIWRRFLNAGQVELTMFGEPAIEPLQVQIAEKDGMVYASTGFGVLAALEARTGEIQWISEYDAIPIEAARTYYAQERLLPWKNQPPVVAEGIVTLAPIDADKAFGFDAATGEARWSIDSTGLRRLVGVQGGRAIFHGQRVAAIDLRTGKLALAYPRSREQPLTDEETGRGIICDSTLVIPQANRLVRIDLRTGERGPDTTLAGGIRVSGTLLYVGRDLVTVNPLQATVFRAYGPSGDPSPAPAPPPGGAREAGPRPPAEGVR